MKKENIKISIIVPVYNVENYIARCVESLIHQTLKDIEIILVDDGSTDNSGRICDGFARKHENIDVIHQRNMGLSAARNTGILHALAPYILFVDSDDYIDLESCEKMYYVALRTKADIVRANSVKVFDKKYIPEKKKVVLEKEIYLGKDFLVQNVKKHAMPMCAPYALYKRDLLKKQELYFKEGILHEDELWTPQVYLKAERVVWIDYNFYYHCIREGSITKSKNQKKNANDLILVCNILFKQYCLLEKKDRNILLDYLCMLYLSGVYKGKIIEADRDFPLKTACSLRNRLKAILFKCSPKFYCKCNDMLKGV